MDKIPTNAEWSRLETEPSNEEWRELDFYYEQDNMWKKEFLDTRPKLSDLQWLEVFPECGPILRRETLKQIKTLKQELEHILKDTREEKNGYATTEAKEHFWIDARITQLEEEYSDIQKRIRAKQWLLKQLDGTADDTDKIGDEQIRQAKEVKVETLMDVGRGKKTAGRIVAKCPMPGHDEKTGSFTIYPNNTYYCFGCNQAGDSIDFIQKTKEMKFLEAVRWLINK